MKNKTVGSGSLEDVSQQSLGTTTGQQIVKNLQHKKVSHVASIERNGFVSSEVAYDEALKASGNGYNKALKDAADKEYASEIIYSAETDTTKRYKEPIDEEAHSQRAKK